MQLKDVEQLLLFHIYYSTRKTKTVFAMPAADLIALMASYDAGGGLVDAAIHELNHKNVRITRFENAEYEEVFKITPNGILEVEEALSTPSSNLMRALERYCPNYRELLDDLGRPELLPASDRRVPLNHNSPEYQDAIKAVDDFIEGLEKTNDIGELTADERVIVLSQARGARKLFDLPEIKISAAKNLIIPLLRWVADKVAGSAVEGWALQALAAISKLLGM